MFSNGKGVDVSAFTQIQISVIQRAGRVFKGDCRRQSPKGYAIRTIRLYNANLPEIGSDLQTSDTGLAGSLGNGIGNGGANSGIEGGGDNVILVQLFIGDQSCQSLSGRHLHLLVDI